MRKLNYDKRQLPYQQVAEDLRDQITSESIQIGEVLPSYRQMAAQYEVSPTTIGRAVDVLIADGFVMVWQGMRARVLDWKAKAAEADQDASVNEAIERNIERIHDRLTALEERVQELELENNAT